jgi:hypothetical protein
LWNRRSSISSRSSHTTRKVSFSAANDEADTHLEFVDKPCLYRLRGEFSTHLRRNTAI